MIASLNEVEGAVLKATRGAGYAWGLAEEAAQSARWLAGRGFDWLPQLLTVLEAPHELSRPLIDPAQRRVTADRPGRFLCPIRTGALLSDLLGSARTAPVTIADPVAAPVLLLPVVIGSSLEQALGLDVLSRALSARAPAAVRVDPAHWSRLAVLEARTYVPASDVSRLAGAGAGLIDND